MEGWSEEHYQVQSESYSSYQTKANAAFATKTSLIPA